MENSVEILVSGARQLGVSLEEPQVDLLTRYLQELQRWNQRIPLTAIREEREIVVKHFLDSLTYRKGFIPREGISVMDVGTGAGFPGVPLKIVYPGMVLTLVDSSAKKTAFLRHLIRVLGLQGVSVLTERVEELGKKAPPEGMTDIVVARALAPTEKIAQWVFPLLKAEGRLILSRGPDIAPEMEAFEGRYPIGGLWVREIIPVTLPFSSYQRNLMVLTKLIENS